MSLASSCGGQTASFWLPGPGLALWPSSNDVCSSSMICWCPILLCLLQHCIWVPWEAFGHILKEWMSLASSCGGQTAPIWLPGPGLALWPSSNDVCSSSMIWCCPILRCLLQHCIWVPWEAFGHILKEWVSLASSCGSKRLRFGCLDQVWHFGPLRMTFAPPV